MQKGYRGRGLEHTKKLLEHQNEAWNTQLAPKLGLEHTHPKPKETPGPQEAGRWREQPNWTPSLECSVNSSYTSPVIMPTVVAPKIKKGLKGSIDDVLGDLLDADDGVPVKSSKPSLLSEAVAGRPKGINPAISKKTLLSDDFFSKLAQEAEAGAAEESDISDADPLVLLESMKITSLSRYLVLIYKRFNGYKMLLLVNAISPLLRSQDSI
uniref:Fas-binding factor 1 n=1 Tax=Geotrypetes seraphini TaxID=260995 RepID=A0A6P8SDT8_GEOSA|nr:fas-binding factor 1 [Geotrypetes seraphini]